MNIGIIGTGFGVKVHIPGFRAVAGVRVLGLAGHSAKKTARVAEELDIPLAFDSWKELIDHPDIHAVSIVSPTNLHKAMAVYAAKRGKHIFCEKPLAMSVKEGEEMLRAARSARIIHMVDFEFRNVPGMKVLASLLKKKTVGNIRHVNIAWLTGGRASMDVPLGWQNDAGAGGGVLFSHGSHVIDYLELLFGKVKSVSARLSIAKKNGATADDTCDMLFTLANDTTANVSISNVLPNARGHAIEVYGDNGSLILENNDFRDFAHGFRLFHFSPKMKQRTEIPIAISAAARKYSDTRLPLFIELAQEFTSAIKRGKGGNPSFVDGLRAQVVMAAARSSDRFKKEMPIG